MAKKPKPKPKPQPTAESRTWDQITGDDDVTGADEAEEESPVEFLRQKKGAPRAKKRPSK